MIPHHEQRAWARLTADMEGDMHQYDYWQDASENVRQAYLDVILLEDAARAAGITSAIVYAQNPDEGWGPYAKIGKGQYWRPLDDDGDALRLAVKLGLEIMQTEDSDKVAYVQVSLYMGHDLCVTEPRGNDHYAATRRAIVRAAAQLPPRVA